MKATIYDFDGPLVHSVKDGYEIYKTFCEKKDIEPPFKDIDGFRKWFSSEWQTNISRLGLAGAEDEAMAHFREYRATHKPLLREGIRNVLAAETDHVNAVLSGDQAAYVRATLERHRLSPFFRHILGYDSWPYAKPHPQALDLTRRLLGFEKRDTVLVGDTIEDIACVHDAGVRVIAISGGWNDDERLQEAGPDEFVMTPSEIPEALRRLGF